MSQDMGNQPASHPQKLGNLRPRYLATGEYPTCMPTETGHKTHLKEAAKWLHGILVRNPIDIVDRLPAGAAKAQGRHTPSSSAGQRL